MKENFTWYVHKAIFAFVVLFWVTSASGQIRGDEGADVSVAATQNVNGDALAGISGDDESIFTSGDKNPLEIEDELAENKFVVYPNPFDNVVYISNYEKIKRLFITNVVGQRVKEITDPANMVSTSELRNGIYFITLMLDDDVIVSTQRIIKR